AVVVVCRVGIARLRIEVPTDGAASAGNRGARGRPDDARSACRAEFGKCLSDDEPLLRHGPIRRLPSLGVVQTPQASPAPLRPIALDLPVKADQMGRARQEAWD